MHLLYKWLDYLTFLYIIFNNFFLYTLFRQQCEPIEEEVCNQVEDKECSDEIETKCETVDEVIEEEICSDVPREDCQLITDQECNTVEEEICDDTATVSILDILLQKKILLYVSMFYYFT